MNFENTIYESLLHYPSLYFRNEFYEYRVMNQLFFTNGNGYEWKNGQLVQQNPNRRGPRLRRSWIKFLDDVLRGYEIDLDYERWGKSLPKMSFYPISKYSKVFNVPEDIKPDWLAGVIHFLEFALVSPDEWYYHDYLSKERNKELATEYKTQIKEQLNKLKEKL